MNNFKNLLIAILTGLLALSLFTQPAQSAAKTYDALKLVQYEACLNLGIHGHGDWKILLAEYKSVDFYSTELQNNCKRYKP